MKTNIKTTLLLLAALVIIGSLLCALVGCAQNEVVDIHNPEDLVPPIYEGDIADLEQEMIPLSSSPPMFTISMPTAPGTNTKKNNKAEIDYSNTKDGYIMVRFLQSTSKQLRVIIKGPSAVQYTYTLKTNGDYEVYPLSDGNGSYMATVYEQIEGTRYSTANSASFDVTLNDEFAPFIRPNQYVNYKPDSKTVAKAAELIGNVDDLPGKISAIYNFVIKNLTYDRELAATVQSGYLPDVDVILEKGKGICFDYAAVMTSMLRSQGIPTKLVVGYAGQAYHAWINVYSDETGWINNVIFFDGKTWKLMDPTFASTGKQSSTVMNYIGDGTNYTSKFLY
ncbi:MAG: lasso peptide biosynthesis protein [Oscillospiraceae bacterium]|nr:lasso peptide biosynthesis protein [Oscillospiraceae bacterium]